MLTPFGFLVSMRGMGLKIPGDIKVVYFSNSKTAARLNPSLTTITQVTFGAFVGSATLSKETSGISFNSTR